MADEDIVVLGRLADPYGIRGWVKLYPFGDDPLDWGDIPVWWIGSEKGPWRQMKLKGFKMHGDGLVVLFDEVPDRTTAEPLKGSLVGVPRELLPKPDDGEYYWSDLIGLAVRNESDELLGKVTGLLETGANDVLRVVDEAGTERLLPFVAAVVLSVDQSAGCIRVAWGSDW